MNAVYAPHAFAVLLLAVLAGLLAWSLGFAVYLNRIHSHGWASTRRLLRTLPAAALGCGILCGFFWEDHLGPAYLLALAGRPSAQMALAARLLAGDHLLARNPAQARAWVARAARSGSAQAQLALATLELDSQGGLKPDPGSALGWARLAAAQGLPAAQMLAGELLFENPALAAPGESAQGYFGAALPLIQAQAAQGNAQALYALGLQKLQGHALASDPEGGYRMLVQARAKGLEPRQEFVVAMVRSRLPADLVRRIEQAP